MDKKLKTKWVKALRSGDYNQGYHALCNARKDGDYFCCLGVLCDIAGGEVSPTKGNSNDMRYWYGGTGYDNSNCHFLPKALRIDSGISSQEQNDLANLNDDGRSFTVIADWIVKYIPEDK
jgi:hypothetical protein